MKTATVIAILLISVAHVEAADQKSKTAATRAPAKTVQPMTVPADAIAGDDNTYTWTDKQGKKWTYIKTPFGVTRRPWVEPTPVMPPSDDLTKVIDKGDVVSFERPGPFGIIRWEKKKADLTEDERRMVEAAKAKQN